MACVRSESEEKVGSLKPIQHDEILNGDGHHSPFPQQLIVRVVVM